MTDLEQRLGAVEERLARMEALLEKQGAAAEATTSLESTFTFEPVPSPRPAAAASAPTGQAFSATQILGWSGVFSLVLAAAYLIKLGVGIGWLTPARQVLMAVLGGGVLIGAGLLLQARDRRYASLLPAGGVVILFLSVYGGHLYYRLLSPPVAVAAVILVCLLALWLCQTLSMELYALFAVAGSYSAPMLLTGLRSGITELAVYYSAWGLLFCAFALWTSRRRVYLLAAYLSLVGFDLVWRFMWWGNLGRQWEAAFTYQTLQFLLFACCAALFSVVHRRPISRNEAWAHAPALLLFYLLQYFLLDRFQPAIAPWVAVASAAVVAILYVSARMLLGREMAGGRLLLGIYVATVLFHAGYLEAVPGIWKPWAALGLAAFLAVYLLRSGYSAAEWPVLLAIGLIFAANVLRIILHVDLEGVPGSDLLVVVYPLLLYGGYALVKAGRFDARASGPLIYCGHLATMAGCVHLLDSRLAVSLGWGGLALACLLWALKTNDRLLGQSSLLIFAASGLKVLLYDLSGAPPLVRIGCLAVLGVTFYVGGWLYRRVGALG